MVRVRPTTSKFLKVRCADCGNEQVVFSKPATVVACLVCDSILAHPKGGAGEFKGEIVGTVE